MCGFLIEEGEGNIRLRFCANRSRREGSFYISMRDWHCVTALALRKGKRVPGSFHSHPLWEAQPGPRDIATLHPGSLMLIYDVIGREARLWRIRKRSAVAEILKIQKRPRKPNRVG